MFWLKDKVTGGKVKEAYKDLENNYFKFDKKKQNEKLNYLLKYAKENCKFYSKYQLSIIDFPVINKQIIKDNFDDIFVKKYNINKLHKMSTSGSTGTPFTVYQNKEKRNRVLAEVLFYGKITDYYFGQKEMYCRSWTKKNKKTLLKQKLQNIIPFDITSLNDKTISNCLNIISKEKNLTCILSYASTLDRICEYIIRSKYSYNNKSLRSIISSSEVLNEETRKKINKLFKCKCYSRYSNQENGILGQDNGVDKTFILNEANYHFEFLKIDSDEEAKEGEISRIVVTDLYNYAMPMIRYDTGDIAIYMKINNKLCITEIYGRRQDIIYDIHNNPISPHGISVNLWGLSNIKQWQFIQKGQKKYKIMINSSNNIAEKEVIEKMKKILGKDANITIEYVSEIPILSSGKTKNIINEIKRGVSR